MPRPTKVDRQALHEYLYSKADPETRQLDIKIVALAEDLGVRRDHMGRIIKEMTEAGRLQRTATRRLSNVGVYRVIDPSTWSEGEQRPRVLAWQ